MYADVSHPASRCLRMIRQGLTTSAIDPDMLKFKVNHDLEVVRFWLRAIKLTFSTKKTKYLIIASN